MKTYLHILLTLLSLSLVHTKAQDIQYTQFYASPMNLNPAFVGANVCSRVSLTYRNQWPGVGNVYSTKLASFDHNFYHMNLGVGLTVGVDEAGAGGLKTTVVNPSIAYEAKINRSSALRFGLQPGIGMKSINMNRLLFGDQIYRGGSNVATLENTPQSKTYFDLGAGVLYAHSNYWAGISAYHLNVPNESFYNNPYNQLPVKLSVHAGAKFLLNKEEKDQRLKKYILPVIHYRAQKKFDQCDIGFYLSKHIFTVGVWYRGLPGIKAYNTGDLNQDALALLIGIQTERIKIGYSYDKTLSDLSTVSKGAHEITLSFQLCNPKKRKTRLVLISCPKF